VGQAIVRAVADLGAVFTFMRCSRSPVEYEILVDGIIMAVMTASSPTNATLGPLRAISAQTGLNAHASPDQWAETVAAIARPGQEWTLDTYGASGRLLESSAIHGMAVTAEAAYTILSLIPPDTRDKPEALAQLRYKRPSGGRHRHASRDDRHAFRVTPVFVTTDGETETRAIAARIARALGVDLGKVAVIGGISMPGDPFTTRMVVRVDDKAICTIITSTSHVPTRAWRVTSGERSYTVVDATVAAQHALFEAYAAVELSVRGRLAEPAAKSRAAAAASAVISLAKLVTPLERAADVYGCTDSERADGAIGRYMLRSMLIDRTGAREAPFYDRTHDPREADVDAPLAELLGNVPEKKNPEKTGQE
jgi:hypothetical protein